MIDSFKKFIAYENPSINWKAEAYYFIGLGYFSLNQFQNAIENFTLSINNFPTHNYFFAYYNRAMSYKFLGAYTDSIDDFSKAIEIDPQYINSYLLRSELYSTLGFRHDAYDDLKTASEIEKNNNDILDKLIFVCMQIKKYDEAIFYINEIIYSNPQNNLNNYFNRGNAYLMLQKYNEAINDFNKAINLGNSLPDVFFSRGFCYAKLNNPKAFEDWKFAADQGHEQAIIYYNKYKK